MKLVFGLLIIFFTQVSAAGYLYTCIKNAFTSSCKDKLYQCTNDPECSYQLHENTHHIFLDEKTEEFPPLYFSNSIARTLYGCLKSNCNLPEIDENYPKTLPFDYCLFEVFDICRGNIEEIYSNPSSTSA